ncbi:response regulator [Cytobacillus sp. FJAT-54145]|uniref:Response regulator n=1 Tax=Cytobacillus spartinae TaxID=3299023 RepID=A0ABW6KA86_9BACI
MAKIVIVDDSRFLRTQLRHLLMKHGHDVVAAGEDGKQGVELYKRHRPDIHFTDITMPGMTGIQSLESILRLDPKAKVVMVSAMGERGMVKEALKIGAKDFIIKPFKDERILEAIDRLMI